MTSSLHQVNRVKGVLNNLQPAFVRYSRSTHDWVEFTATRLPSTYTQEEFEARQEQRSTLFTAMEGDMITCRRLHDDYMKEESILNQMGRMKPNGF